uniref:RT_RNaseH domain-containing protein n=1 Tax=Heterorhabditis bacteriophora TaxID=37862 RepID=A0A1I7W6D9_HETBA
MVRTIEGVLVYSDGITVTSPDDRRLLKRLYAVPRRLKKFDVRVSPKNQLVEQFRKQADKHYKEVLNIIYGVEKFKHVLHGREYVLLTDHKPLLNNRKKMLPVVAVKILNRWALKLINYSYDNKRHSLGVLMGYPDHPTHRKLDP